MAKIVTTENTSKKEVIARHAAVLFREKGFAATSMRELADSMGVEAPSLYNHIGSKSEILQIICFKVASEYNTHIDRTEKLNAGVLQKLEDIIRFHISMMLNDYNEVFVASHEWKQLQEPFLNDFMLQRRNYEGRLINVIKEGIRQKEIKPIHPYVAVLTILSAVRGLESWHRHKKNVSASELENGMTDHLLNGLTL